MIWVVPTALATCFGLDHWTKDQLYEMLRASGSK